MKSRGIRGRGRRMRRTKSAIVLRLLKTLVRGGHARKWYRSSHDAGRITSFLCSFEFKYTFYKVSICRCLNSAYHRRSQSYINTSKLNRSCITRLIIILHVALFSLPQHREIHPTNYFTSCRRLHLRVVNLFRNNGKSEIKPQGLCCTSPLRYRGALFRDSETLQWCPLLNLRLRRERQLHLKIKNHGAITPPRVNKILFFHFQWNSKYCCRALCISYRYYFYEEGKRSRISITRTPFNYTFHYPNPVFVNERVHEITIWPKNQGKN